MACVPIPTETLYSTVITTGQSATFSESITTIPPLVTTIVSTACSTVVGGGLGGGDCVQVPVTVVSTIDDGGESVIQVPVVVTFPVTTEVPTLTLFAPCPSDPPPPPSPPVTPPPPPPTSVPPPPQDPSPPSSSSTPLVPTVVTPIPDVYTSAFSSTLPDGNVVWTSVIITSTHPPTSILVPSRSTPAGGSTTSAASGNEKVGDILGPVLGGALGGFFGLLGLVGLCWLCWKKRDAIFRFSSGMDEDIPYSYSPEPPINAADEPEPKPYHYGLVGRASSHPSRGGSPPPPSPHSRSGSTPTIVNANIGRQSPVVMTAMANIAPSVGNRRMSGSSNANMGLSVPVDQAVHLRKRSPTPSQTTSFHSHSQSFSQSTRPASRTSMSMNPGALNAASSSSSTTTPGLRVTPSPTFPVTSSGPPSASSGLVPRSNHPSSSSRLSPSRLSGASSLAPQPTQASPQLPPATQLSQQPSPRPFPIQSPPPYQTPQPSPMQVPSQSQASTSSQYPPSHPLPQSHSERGIQDPRILQQQQLAALPPGAGPSMMRQSWPRYLSNDGVPGSGSGYNIDEDYDEFGRYLLTSGGSGQGAVNAGNGGGREARFASEGRPYGGIPGRVPGPIPIAASVSLGGGAMSVVRGGNGKGVDVRTTSHVSSGVPSTSTSLSSAPPATPGMGFSRPSEAKSLLDIAIPSSSFDFPTLAEGVEDPEEGKRKEEGTSGLEVPIEAGGGKRPHLKRSSTVDSEVIRTLAMERLGGGRHNVLYVVNREASVESLREPPAHS